MNEIQSGLTFKQAKELADRAILDVKNGIVAAGYALQAIRRDRLWESEGYKSFDNFMERCYQKDKSWASNCIRVYEQFGELAGPEQMPRLQERYQEYSAGGLIEMLSMPEEMREQVTAEMPVREIRELKREARKVATSQPEEEQLPGQMDITDFLDEPEKEQEPEEIIFLPELKTSGSFVLAAEDLAEEGLDEEQAAGRQQETDCPPGISSYIWQNWGTREKDQEEAEDMEEHSWPKTCITGWSKYGNCVCCGYGGVRCCKDCEEGCNCRCGWIPEKVQEPDVEEEEQQEEQRNISVEGLLEKYEKELTEMQEAFQDTPKEQWPLAVEKTQILTAALRLLAEQERRQQEEPERRKYYGRKISPIGVQRYYKPSERWEVPGPEYFRELERVSKEQIIWGCNYFDYHFPPGRIVWDKCNENSSFSDCEIASCSLHDSVRIVRYMWNGMFQGKSLKEGTVQQGNKALNEKRIHPTQKPVALYDWLLTRYAVPGVKILDTHAGSASSLIACHKAGVSYIGFEKNRHYYDLANERLEEYKSQITLWDCGLERRTKWED